MVLDGWVLDAEFFLYACHVVVNDGGVFTVCHEGQSHLFCEGEEAVEGFFLIDEHVACGGAHEEFDAWHLVDVELAQLVEVVVGGAREEGVVDVHALDGHSLLVAECLEGGGLRLGVGHVEDGGDASIGGSTALALHGGFVGEPWLAEVYVGVDDAWQHVSSLGVYNSIEGTSADSGADSFGYDFVYAVVVDDEVGFLPRAFIDDGAALDE